MTKIATCAICLRIQENRQSDDRLLAEAGYTVDWAYEAAFSVSFEDPVEGAEAMNRHFAEKHPVLPVRSWEVTDDTERNT